MKLSEIHNITNEKVTLYREGEFFTVKLIGIEKNIPQKAITYIESIDYLDKFLNENVECVICLNELANILMGKYNGGIITSSNPKTSFFEIHNYIARKNRKPEQNQIDPTARIHPSAIISNEGVCIGKNTVISANAIIEEGVKIGDNCIIRENAIIGSPGYYYYGENENKRLVESAGTVCIGNNVEIHHNTVVEKGVLYGVTIINDNTKIDNLTLISHDSKIGKSCIIAGGTAFAGGVSLGNDSFVGMGVSVAPYVNIGDNVKISAGAVVTKNVKSNMQVSGNFAIDHVKYLKFIKNISQ